MTLLLMEGFDVYNGLGANTGLISRWAAPGGSGQSMTAGRFGGQAWRLQPAIGQAIMRQLPAAGTTFAVGAAIRCTSLFPGTPSAKAHICLYNNASGFQTSIVFDANGSISAWRCSGDVSGTLLGTSAINVMAANVWHYIEVEFVISTTVGRVTVYVDGVQKLNLTGVNTANLGVGTTADSIRLSSTNGGNGNGGFVDYDDMYIIDAAAKLGERKVETLVPTSDVAAVFTHNIGTSNFSAVDDPQANGDTDYVQSSNVGDTDTYGFSDLTSVPATIDGVQVIAFAQKTDAATRAINLQLKSGATTDNGANFNLAVGYQRFDRLLGLDPNGSIAWTAANVNALQGGPKIAV